MIQTVQGLRFLRDNEIVHLDLKPHNLLIGRGLQLKITDFG
jgi:serine/threonine protein kinase